MARAIDAQRANPDTQAAMVGAAIEALVQRATSEEPSPHEARAINHVLTTATQTVAASPVWDFMLDRIQRTVATQTTGPTTQANQVEFLRTLWRRNCRNLLKKNIKKEPHTQEDSDMFT